MLRSVEAEITLLCNPPPTHFHMRGPQALGIFIVGGRQSGETTLRDPYTRASFFATMIGVASPSSSKGLTNKNLVIG